jgi:hypothetical protein
LTDVVKVICIVSLVGRHTRKGASELLCAPCV